MSTPNTNGIVIMPCEVAHEAPCERCGGIGRVMIVQDRQNNFERGRAGDCPACLGGKTQSAAALVAQGHKEDS